MSKEFTPYITEPRPHELKKMAVSATGRELTYHYTNKDILEHLRDHNQSIKALALGLDVTPAWVRQCLRKPLGAKKGLWMEMAKQISKPPVVIEEARPVVEEVPDASIHLAEWMLFERAKNDRELAKIIDTLGYSNDFWK